MRDSYTNRNHTKCGRMRGMVVGEGGCSSGVLLYLYTLRWWQTGTAVDSADQSNGGIAALVTHLSTITISVL